MPALGPGTALLAYLLLVVSYAAVGFSTQPRDPVLGLWLTEALAIALPAVIALRWANVRPGPFLGLGRASAAALLLAAGVAALNQPIIALLEHGAQAWSPEPWVRMFEHKNRILETLFEGRKAAMVVTVILAAPIAEELFFRGFMQPALERRIGFIPALLATSALFSAIHLDPVGFIGLMQLGMLFGLLRHATGSLWPSMMAHATNNALAATAFLLGLQKPEEKPPAWLLWIGAGLFAAALPLAFRLARRPDPQPAREEPWSAADPAGTFRLARAAPLAAVWALAVIGGVALLLKR